MSLQVLGAGGPEINDGLASSSFLVWINGKTRVMVDAGGGSSLNFEKSSADFNDLSAILITHFHVDHTAAIPVYIKGGYFTGRDTNLPLFGPTQGSGFPSTESFINALFSEHQKSAYPYLNDNLEQQPSTDFLLVAESVDPENKIWKRRLSKDLSISAINVHHSFIPALAWRVDYKGCSITFSGDMNGTSNNLPLLAKNTNLLVANNAIPEDAFSVAKKLHMTPSVIGDIAVKSGANKLLLAHFMSRTINKKSQTVSIIRNSYRGEIIPAKELERVNLK